MTLEPSVKIENSTNKNLYLVKCYIYRYSLKYNLSKRVHKCYFLVNLLSNNYLIKIEWKYFKYLLILIDEKDARIFEFYLVNSMLGFDFKYYNSCYLKNQLLVTINSKSEIIPKGTLNFFIPKNWYQIFSFCICTS